MIVGAVIDHVGRGEGRHDHRRHADAVTIEHEPELVHRTGGRDLVCGLYRRAGVDVIVEAAVLVPGDDQHAALPDRRVPDRFVGVLDQPFAGGDVVDRMLRCTAAIAVVQGASVVGFDPCELAWIVPLEVGGEPAVVPHVPGQLNALERPGDGKAPCRWTNVASIDSPLVLVRAERVEQRSVLEAETVHGLPLHDLVRARRPVKASSRRGHREEPIRPRRTGHRGAPVVADSEVRCQCVQHGKLARGVALHDLTGVCLTARPRIVGDEPGVVDRGVWTARRISGSGAGQLLQHVEELVQRIQGHRDVRALGHRVALSRVVIRLRTGEPIDRGLRVGHRVGARDARETEHVVERAVLQHQHEDVVDQLSRHLPPRRG